MTGRSTRLLLIMMIIIEISCFLMRSPMDRVGCVDCPHLCALVTQLALLHSTIQSPNLRWPAAAELLVQMAVDFLQSNKLSCFWSTKSAPAAPRSEWTRQPTRQPRSSRYPLPPARRIPVGIDDSTRTWPLSNKWPLSRSYRDHRPVLRGCDRRFPSLALVCG